MIGKATAHSSARAGILGGLFVGATGGDAPKRLFRAVGSFLSDHGLDPTPANYALAHAYVTRSDMALVKAVNDATFGDTRLSQADADRIGGTLAGRGGGGEARAAVAELAIAIDDARERFERYAGIVDTSHADARAYGVALATGAATLAPAAPASVAPRGGEAGALAALLAVTHAMIDKTRIAEDQLRAASKEMSELRANLVVARQDAETDALTGLPNRRAFEAAFPQRRRGEASPGDALAMCDIDRFKTVNDIHGHEVGDRVIRLVARELANGCVGAVVARYGGEEFVILFEGLDRDEAARVLDRTRVSIGRRNFRVSGTGATLDELSFSGGVVSVLPNESVRDAVRRADAALYRAKQNGRDRIERGD